MSERIVTAVEMARTARIDPKAFRGALRKERFPWHIHNSPWSVREGTSEHQDMLRVPQRMNEK